MSVGNDEAVLEYDHYDLEWGSKIEFPNTRTFRQGSHRVFNRYPARSISLVPRAIIRSTLDRGASRLRILDPFMGSGTTAVETVYAGQDAYGVEIDPLARLIAEVRVHRYSDEELQELQKVAMILERDWQNTTACLDHAPRLRNVDHWFSESQFNDLLKFKTCLYEVVGTEGVIADFFRVVLADMIRPTSLAERQSLKPYISKKYRKTQASVGDAFRKSFNSHFAAMEEFRSDLGRRGSRGIQWLGHDATNFSSGRRSVSCAITSPPYANALDYVRCIKIESAWVDCGNDDSFCQIRKGQVGDSARSKIDVHHEVDDVAGAVASKIGRKDPLRGATVLAYFQDVFANLNCVYESLTKGGEYHMIIGNSVIRGVDVATHELTARLAERAGFSWVQYYFYPIRDHRTSMPRKGQGGKIKYEHVVSFRKD